MEKADIPGSDDPGKTYKMDTNHLPSEISITTADAIVITPAYGYKAGDVKFIVRGSDNPDITVRMVNIDDEACALITGHRPGHATVAFRWWFKAADKNLGFETMRVHVS